MSAKLDGNGVGAATLSMAGPNIPFALPAPPRKREREAHWVWLGCGGGGAIARIEAADAGADLIILEKNPADRHICNTNVSGGIFISPTDVEKAFQYVRACIG